MSLSQDSAAANDWWTEFRSPPSQCRPQLQWSWNGLIHPERIRVDLADFKAKGIGGFFTHARPGLEMGYLQEEWFAAWKTAADHCRALGLEWHIYDEYTCPGGLAGGHTVATAPHTAATQLTLVRIFTPEAIPGGEIVAWFEEVPSGEIRRLPHAKPADVKLPAVAAVIEPVPARVGQGNFPAADLTHPDACRAFLKTTHERYAAIAGEHFGSTTRYCFCDEPAIYHRDGLLMSRRILREFEAEHGWRLEDRLEDLCFERAETPAVRYAYWSTLHRLWEKNFLRPLCDWCSRNDLRLTGHFMENQWPSPRANTDSMAHFRWMHTPGNDLLGFQFSPTELADNALYLLNLKELSSVSSQLGRPDAMVESCGGGNYGASFELFKTCEDFLLAFGTSVIDPHLSHWTLGGARKYDWAHTLSQHSPWWECYREQADHVARVVAAQRQGREENRILVLHPTLSAWLHEAPRTQPWGSKKGSLALEELKRSATSFYLELYQSQIDFDLGDEFILEEFGSAKDGTLTVGERSYELVVLPPGCQTLRKQTVQLLNDLMRNGGRILSMEDFPKRVDGLPGDAAEESPNWIVHPNRNELVRSIRESVPPRISGTDGSPLPADLVWRRTQLPGGDRIWFFCAPWEELPIETTIRFPSGTGPLVELDTRTGECSRQFPGNQPFQLQLPPRGHRLLLEEPDAPADGQTLTQAATAPDPLKIRARDLVFESMTRLEPNLLCLDYCQLSHGGGRFGPFQNTVHADARNWQHHGFHKNPWVQAHMFNRTWLEYPFDPESGCEVAYEFILASDAVDRESLEIVIERPWLYSITLNGLPVDGFSRWFDEEFARARIWDAARLGRNRLVLEAQPMSALIEIMPVYVRGEFDVRPVAAGFELVASRPSSPGDVTQNGAPFYRGWLRYRFTFDTERPTELLEVTLPDWEGAAARARVDTQEQFQQVLHPPYHARFSGDFPVGRHVLEVEIASTLYNMLGPHHHRGLSGHWSWNAAPADQPAGTRYDLDPFGMFFLRNA